MKRSLLNPWDVSSKRCKENAQEWGCAWTPASPTPATMTATPATMTAATPTTATPSASLTSAFNEALTLPDGYFHLGGDMLVGVTEFLGYLKVHVRQYVIKNNQYVPTKTGITLSPYHWQVLSDTISTLNLESPHACLMIERKLFLSVTDTSVVFQHVFGNNPQVGVQLSYAFLSVTHQQFRELCRVRESISQLMQKRLLGPLFLKAIRDVLIVMNPEDVHPDDDETNIQETLKSKLITVLKKHISRTLDSLPIMCKGCLGESEHTCLDTRFHYLNRCIASIDISNLAHDFVYDNRSLYPYMSEHFIQNLNVMEIFDLCKFHLSV